MGEAVQGVKEQRANKERKVRDSPLAQSFCMQQTTVKMSTRKFAQLSLLGHYTGMHLVRTA